MLIGSGKKKLGGCHSQNKHKDYAAICGVGEVGGEASFIRASAVFLLRARTLWAAVSFFSDTSLDFG